MQSKLTVYFLIIILLVPVSLCAQGNIEISLKTVMLPDTGKLVGMGNFLFNKLPAANLKYPATWREIEVSNILSDESFLPINLIRYKDTFDSVQYVVDTDGDSDFNYEPVLSFRKVGDRSIADVVLQVQQRANVQKHNYKVTYQIILADKAYARVAEYRSGSLRLDNNEYPINLRPLSRNNPLFSLSGETVCLIDMNRDGIFSSRWQIANNTELVRSEEIYLSEPFLIDGKKLKAVAIDSMGSKLVLQESFDSTAAAVGFKAPELRFSDLNGMNDDVVRMRGKVVLIMFCSITCPYCEQIRPQLNSIIQQNKSQDFSVIALCKERNVDEIKTFLLNHPYEAKVGLAEPSLWQRYYIRYITPLFYLIDQEGVIRLIATGAAMAPVLELMLKRLLSPH